VLTPSVAETKRGSCHGGAAVMVSGDSHRNLQNPASPVLYNLVHSGERAGRDFAARLDRRFSGDERRAHRAGMK
jgi:hypothetical protein